MPENSPAVTIISTKATVRTYAIGSFDPLSSSSSGRSRCFRPMRCVRSRLNTEAESVDDTVAASSIDMGSVSPMSSRVHSDR